MITTIKKAQFATANNSKIGDKLAFLVIPYYKEDMTIFYKESIIDKIIISKTGKRVEVIFTDGKTIGNQGLNTPLQVLTDKFINEIATVRGWRK
jgi:hypothetical protein